ncbi:MAG: hypothetical protein NUV46_03750 [Nanoarchaeota archaeon]|nr:hypothetical protein [Nanoarchaeota archaeon]
MGGVRKLQIISKTDRDFISEVIIIISGFIIAETFVRKIIDGSDGLIDWWVLPLLAIMFLILAFEIRNQEKRNWFYYISYLFYPLLIYYVYLLHSKNITNIIYLVLTIGTIIIYGLLSLIKLKKLKENINGKFIIKN